LTKGSKLFERDRLACLVDLISQFAERKKFPDFHINAALSFVFDFEPAWYHEELPRLWSAIFQNVIVTVSPQKIEPLLDAFLNHFPPPESDIFTALVHCEATKQMIARSLG
jgi:hypothetical protein